MTKPQYCEEHQPQPTPPRPPAQVLEELAAIIHSAGTFRAMGGYSADYFRHLCGQWAEQLRELSAIVRGQEGRIAFVQDEMRAMARVAGQSSVEQRDPLLASADARFADFCAQWADDLAPEPAAQPTPEDRP